jgi:hypothetical protein
MDFSFQIIPIQNNPVFDIQPSSGIIPANNHINIIIKYSPKEFCTSSLDIQITVSQFSCQPYNVNITGTSEPGLATKTKLKQMESILKEIVDPRCVSPLGRSRSKKQLIDSVKPMKANVTKGEVKIKEKSGKLQTKDMKDSWNKNQDELNGTSNPMKENMFEHLVSKNVSEEERNQLRWGMKLGEGLLTEKKYEDILKKREQFVKDYHSLIGDVDENNGEFQRHTLTVNEDKIIRSANNLASCHPTFDVFLNDNWQIRHLVLGKFIQAVRKVIWMTRATRGLKAMKRYLTDWRHGSLKIHTKKLSDEDSKEESLVENVSLEVIGSRILPFSFPEDTRAQEQEEMAGNDFFILPVRPTTIVHHSMIGMYNLKVPLQFKLLHYNFLPYSSATSKYIPKALPRKLRSSPKSEVVQPLIQEENVDGEVEVIQMSNSSVTSPSYLLELRNYHPLHVFNPMPGVSYHPQVLAYSEVDEDYSLSPLSRATPKKVEREGVISGIMNWRKFPSHGVVAMSSPSLYHVYVPRWSNPFDEELIPADVPPFLSSLPHNDELNEELNEELNDQLNDVVPSIEMVTAEFTLIDDELETNDSETLPNCNNPQSINGMLSRGKMKEKLNRHLHLQMNSLGSRF